jgi:hypothetical protein
MKPAVFTTYVTARGYFPHLVIDAQATAISKHNDQPPIEIELSDNDAFELFHKYRFPTADFG